MDRAIFFASVRARLFGGALTPAQVDGMTSVLDECAARGLGDPRAVAYVLATAYHETGRRMRPVREIGGGGSRAYARPDPRTGQVYDGRGYVQITWKANYRRLGDRLGVDLVSDPDRALEPGVAAAILVVGMKEGLFSGHALSEYFGAANADWVGARRVVNGLDRAVAIAAYARAFHDALLKAARGASDSTPAESLRPPPGRPPALARRLPP
ncbi:MAG: hypothetical protein HZY79_15070 [Rhodoblastus sp.]|nr:MAG: hypothetical protein HZY79_15070 [Rhodoblastus sp.]